MASIDVVTKLLKQGIRFGAVGRVPPKQIDEAAERLSKIHEVNWELLEQIGRELTGDRLLFNDVDIGRLNEALEKRRKSGRTEDAPAPGDGEGKF